MDIKRRIVRSIHRIIQHKYPKLWFEMIYKWQYGHKFDWNNPQDLIEKQRWIQFNTDISEWTQLADKYRVREYIENKGLGDMLVPLLGVWKRAEDIDFEKLPNEFVLKTNHGSGEVIIVNNKNEIDQKYIREKMGTFINTPFGYECAETHYLKISPLIIAEKLLKPLPGEKELRDYKFYTFYGKPIACSVMTNRVRGTHIYSHSVYDMEWNKIEVDGVQGGEVQKPSTFACMKEACMILAKQFPFVRMDFYEVEGKLYFGEFTFTPVTLRPSYPVFMHFKTEWGNMIDLSIYKNMKHLC